MLYIYTLKIYIVINKIVKKYTIWIYDVFQKKI